MCFRHRDGCLWIVHKSIEFLLVLEVMVLPISVSIAAHIVEDLILAQGAGVNLCYSGNVAQICKANRDLRLENILHLVVKEVASKVWTV